MERVNTVILHTDIQTDKIMYQTVMLSDNITLDIC